MNVTKGAEREKSIEREGYLNDNYFSVSMLATFAHQINDIYTLRPGNIIEIGIGNGFTSTFLKSAGYDVTTCDINENLGPDHVLQVQQLASAFPQSQFDLAVCCEVLEHIPFEEFEPAVAAISNVADRLYLTLPNYRKYFGISGFFDFPRIRKLFNIGAYIRIPRPVPMEHFWELDSYDYCTRKNVEAVLRKYYPKIETHNHKLNRYHRVFICEK